MEKEYNSEVEHKTEVQIDCYQSSYLHKPNALPLNNMAILWRME